MDAQWQSDRHGNPAFADGGGGDGQRKGEAGASSKNNLDNLFASDQSPAISLPKGGGAIRGMGETFEANPATGTGSMSVPIALTPGRSGFGPKISLSYDSGRGNGPFGLGWALSLPMISRRTDRGLPQYNDEDDVFVLSGTEDLVPISSSHRNHPLYEPERDGYAIRRYCPRIEGAFARIEKWTSTSDASDVYWRSITADNVTTLYGRDSRSRVYDPEAPARIFQWLMSTSYDNRGNVIVYDYKAEDSSSVPITVHHEQYRTDLQRSANKYLKSMRYGNRVPNQSPETTDVSAWMFEAVLDYGEHDELDPKPNDGGLWSYRQDPFSAFRSTFELRTYRLCRRVLMFHRILTELNEPVTLVRSTEFVYNQNEAISFLTAVIQSGHVRPSINNPSHGAPYITQSLPPTEFEYLAVPTSDQVAQLQVRTVDQESLENLPVGVDAKRNRWVDLDGNGLPSVLTEEADQWYYKRNQSANNVVPAVDGIDNKRVDPKFASYEILSSKPGTFSLSTGGAMFMDIDGDGLVDLVTWDGNIKGYHARLSGKMNRMTNNKESTWDIFQHFQQCPNVNMNDPRMCVVDIIGDGRPDLMKAEDNTITWYPSLGRRGFGASHILCGDGSHGPRVSFSKFDTPFCMADMSGDGLPDLVCVQHGCVSYWPNLGYGCFGSEVTMDNPPFLDSCDSFDYLRVRLADIDGSGTSDLIYLTPDGVKIYRNNSGNSWDKEQTLSIFPYCINNYNTVDVVDLLGIGTACVVWSSSLLGDTSSPMLYLDLMNGRKPHLLTRVINNLGAETQIHYSPSTFFSLNDAAAGKPWKTRLPFPVHCVERVVSRDRVSRSRYVSKFAYHHGCFDGFEREFRGFGAVERWDTEEYFLLPDDDEMFSSEFSNLDKETLAPPIHTKMWFHPGIYIDENELSRGFASEYFGAPALDSSGFTDFVETLLPDSSLPLPDATLTGREMREACRALKGRLVRQEIYSDDAMGEDDPDIQAQALIPYSVAESNYSVELVQRQEGNHHAVFFAHTAESLTHILDRNHRDPCTSHEFILQVDKYGNVRRRCSVRYGRKDGQSPLSGADLTEQQRIHVTYTETDYTKDVDTSDAFRLPNLCEIRSYEVTGFEPSEERFSINEFTKNNFAPLNNLVKISFEQQPTNGIGEKRLLAHSKSVYRSDDLSTLLPLGELESRAIAGKSYNLAFTPGLLDQVYKRKKADGTVVDLLPSPSAILGGLEGGYVDLETDDHWWVPTGRMYFHPDPTADAATELALAIDNFFLPRRMTDIFGNSATIGYDDYKLLAIETEDAIGNRIECMNDYRLLRPKLLTDANGNQAEVAYDALGMIVGTAVMGKPGEHLGDSVSTFKPDLTQDEIDEFFADPSGPLARRLLGNAGTRYIYDIGRFWREPDKTKKLPSFTAMLVRETHASDVDAELGLRVALSYSDGYERVIQTKTQVDPGPLFDGGPVVNDRWLGSGWIIYNNKGVAVRKFEPFFDDTFEYKFDKRVGVSPITLYDPLGRVVGNINPDHSWRKVVFTPWEVQAFDANDTVKLDPKSDPDVGRYVKQLPDSDYLPTWYQARITGGRGPEARNAALKAAVHANTPSKSHMDSLGRPFLKISDNGTQGKFESRVVLNIQGKQLEMKDTKQRIASRFDYDMLGNVLHQATMEGGERWMLNNAIGSRLFSWNSRSLRFHSTYDTLHRPVLSLVLDEGATDEVVVRRVVFGDTLGTIDPSLNLRKQPFQLFDGAGVMTTIGYDFKGNMLGCKRQLAEDYRNRLDWSLGTLPMDGPEYLVSEQFDAFNCRTSFTAPDNTVVKMTYDKSAALQTVSANLRGEKEPGGNSIWTQFVTSIEYDAKGQRKSITYDNKTSSTYTYDSETFRLTRLASIETGSSDYFQDLNYTYDAAGNITTIRDDAQQSIFFRGQKIDPSNEYTYDAIYRLIEATGREHLGQNINQPNLPTPPTAFDKFHTRLDHPGNSNAMGRYVESYDYDSAGNILALRHSGSQPASAGWTRSYNYEEPSQLEPPSSGIQNNRLSSITIGSSTETFKYDGEGGIHGLMTSMPQLSGMTWDADDQLQSTTQQRLNGSGTPETTYYVHGASGERLRKVTERQAAEGQTATRMKESIHIGIFEIHRKYMGDGKTVSLERESIHVTDHSKDIAIVQTRTKGTDLSPRRVIRYQYGNHLGSSCLELDEIARLISYEEYYPYGSTSYQAQSSIVKVPKRYCYIGKERDKENGLDYHGRRYYASWIGRWISADPGGLIDGPNLFWYARDSPIMLKDPGGFAANTADDVTVVTRDKRITKDTPQDVVRQLYGQLKVPVYYTGDATWNVKKQSWVVTDAQRLTGQPPSVSENAVADANPAAVEPPSDPPPSETPSDSKGTAQDQPGVAESFAYGFAKGLVTGIVVGAVLGAVIASGGTLAPLAVAVGQGMMALAVYEAAEVATGRDFIEGKDLTDNERAEKAGGLIGGMIGGGIGAKLGGPIGARFAKPGGGSTPGGGGAEAGSEPTPVVEEPAPSPDPAPKPARKGGWAKDANEGRNQRLEDAEYVVKSSKIPNNELNMHYKWGNKEWDAAEDASGEPAGDTPDVLFECKNWKDGGRFERILTQKWSSEKTDNMLLEKIAEAKEMLVEADGVPIKYRVNSVEAAEILQGIFDAWGYPITVVPVLVP